MKKALFLFGELNDDDLDWIIKTGQLERIPPETILITEGEALDNIYILLKGRLEVFRENNDHHETIDILGIGEVFGEISFVDDRLPSATVKSIEKSLVLTLPRFQLANRLHQDVGFSSRFYKAIALFLSSRLRNTLKNANLVQERQNSIEMEDLPPAFLDSLPFAEARFDWLLRRVNNLIT